jgi:hypothetical protein
MSPSILKGVHIVRCGEMSFMSFRAPSSSVTGWSFFLPRYFLFSSRQVNASSKIKNHVSWLISDRGYSRPPMNFSLMFNLDAPCHASRENRRIIFLGLATLELRFSMLGLFKMNGAINHLLVFSLPSRLTPSCISPVYVLTNRFHPSILRSFDTPIRSGAWRADGGRSAFHRWLMHDGDSEIATP